MRPSNSSHLNKQVGPSQLNPPSATTLRPDKDGWYGITEATLSASTAQPQSTRPSSASGLGRPSGSSRPPSSAAMRPPLNPGMRPPSSAAIRASQSAPLRPSSSASIRPSSSASLRPSSSTSIRPGSSASIRPGSSASTLRPGTSASVRRPISRLSQRPPTRQSARILPLCETLVSQVTGIFSAADEETHQTAVEFVTKNLDSTIKPGGSTGWAAVDKMIRGHVKKARITSKDTLADALGKAYERLKDQVKNHSDFDADIQRSRIPDHLNFLVALSSPPTSTTTDLAEQIIDTIDNAQQEKARLTWEDIFAEEPLEGQHWEGVYGLPPGTTVEDWGNRSDGSSPSLSPWGSDSDVDSTRLSDIPETPPTPPLGPISEVPRLDPPLDPMNAYRHRQDVEELHSRQYWRSDWQSDASVNRQFDLGDASSLAPAFHRALGTGPVLNIHGPAKENYRNEEDIVREVLTGLQGRRNMMFTWVDSGPEAFSFVLSSSAPRLLHLTAGAQASIISSFASLATSLVHLRKFTCAIFAKASSSTLSTSTNQDQPAYLSRAQRRTTQTLEALADALDAELRAFDAWCAQREEDICHARAGLGGKLVVSLLSLEKAIRDSFGSSFPVFLDVMRHIVRCSQRLRHTEEVSEVWTLPDLPQRVPPSTVTASLLNALLVSAQEHVSMGDSVTSSAIVRVFAASVEPLWSMIHRWMRDGMPVRDGQLGALTLASAQVPSSLKTLQDEFFVEDSEMLMLDPDFWTEGFALRGGHSGISQGEGADELMRPNSVPIFLIHVAELVLATGKVTGLLRVLGISALFDGELSEDERTAIPWMADWRSFRMLLEKPQVHQLVDGVDVAVSLEGSVASSENLSQIVYDELLPYSDLAHEALRKVLMEECELWVHLNAMEDLFLMRRGDAMSHFVDTMFTRMDSHERWNDFHFMNSAFRDVVSLYSGPTRWIDASLVRFSFPHKVQGQGVVQEKNIAQTVRALDGLLIEYAVPFPLTYIFGPRSTRVYSSIFTLVLQIRRAKSVLERILVRGGLGAGKQLDAEMKVFYAMRGRLSWFVNTLLNFITTNVIHMQVIQFHEAFKQARSFDDMIRLQNQHLDKLERRCFLQTNTVALHRALMSILDMALHYTNCFVSFAGDTTHDISRASLTLSRHRHRHLRKQRRDVIGFFEAPSFMQESEDESSDEEELDEDSLAGRAGREPSFSFGASATASFTEDGFLTRLDKMASELDALVRFVRRGVESLAAEASEAAPAFGIFAFALEDWDR